MEFLQQGRLCADTVWQAIFRRSGGVHLKLYSVEHILILAGDHIYNMDYGETLAEHNNTAQTSLSHACRCRLPTPPRLSSRALPVYHHGTFHLSHQPLAESGDGGALGLVRRIDEVI